MQLYTLSYPSNDPIDIDPLALPAGTESSKTREDIITEINTKLKTDESYISWESLGIAYFNNPYTDSLPPSTYLRILAAKNSIDLGSSVNFQNAKVTQKYFPSTYVSSSTEGPALNSSFMETLYAYYQTKDLWFKIFPAVPAGTPSVSAVYQIVSATTAATLKFIVDPAQSPLLAPSPIYIDLSTLTMEKLLSGATWSFIPSNTDINYTNEISKLLSSLWSVGQLPYIASVTTKDSPFVNNNDGFMALSYFTEPASYLKGPWFNLYSQIIHEKLISKGKVPSNPTLGLGYAYDYDDLLNMSGIVGGLKIQDIYGNPSTETTTGNPPIENPALQPYIVVSLESMLGTPIPQISQDAYSYVAIVAPAPNGVAVSFSHYNGTSMIVTPASVTTPVSLGAVTVDSAHPFRVTFSYNSIDYVYDINLQRQIATPISNRSSFSSTDVYFQGSITFAVAGTETNPTFVISFTSAPPPWGG